MCGTHPLYEGTTISVNTDSCGVTTTSELPVQAIVEAVTAPVSHEAQFRSNTNFEELCSATPLKINNACFDKSRGRQR